MNTQILITQSGLTDLQAELIEMQAKRPQVVERLSVARSMGDLSENSDYISAREELEFLDSRIGELEDMIHNSKVVSPANNDRIDFGHLVTVKVDSTQTTFQIVGEPEADPKKRKISHQSPLGQALMGKKVGEKVEVEAPVGKLTYSILAIS
jgi:transcription elongation factor GreA